VTDFDIKAAKWDSDPRRVERARAVADSIRKNVPLFLMIAKKDSANPF
jgi:hypothetical protein